MTMPTVPCQACGKPLIPVDGCVVHPGCPLPGMSGHDSPEADALKDRITNMIRYASSKQPRSLQVAAGPSDLVSECDRRVGYKLAGISPVNFTWDPWPAIVGEAAHAWLEKAAHTWNTDHPADNAWHTEVELQLDETFPAHSDLYLDETVIDYKTKSAAQMTRIKDLGATTAVPDAIKQVQLYGLAFQQAGFPVKRVGLVFLPRSGSLRSMMTWVGRYDKRAAQAILNRAYSIVVRLNELDIISNPHRWEQVAATPGDACGLCSLYSPDKILESGADNTGCPGR